MTAEEKIAKLLEYIRSGRTVWISTAWKCTEITPKTLAEWDKAGLTLLKAKGNSMYIAAGKRFECIDYCDIRVSVEK